MKFINYLTSISGVGIFPLISLLMFVAFFVFLGIYVLKADKNRLAYIASLPIDENNTEKNSEKDANL